MIQHFDHDGTVYAVTVTITDDVATIELTRVPGIFICQFATSLEGGTLPAVHRDFSISGDTNLIEQALLTAILWCNPGPRREHAN